MAGHWALDVMAKVMASSNRRLDRIRGESSEEKAGGRRRFPESADQRRGAGQPILAWRIFSVRTCALPQTERSSQPILLVPILLLVVGDAREQSPCNNVHKSQQSFPVVLLNAPPHRH